MTAWPESTWTAPRPDCPHPEWWHSSDDHSTEHEVTDLVAGLIRALQPELVVETGTCWGQTAEQIGHALLANGHGHLVTLEPDPEKAAASRSRCAGLPVTVLEQESLTWTPTGPVGFAWFDSLFELRAAEFRHYLPWLRAGTVVAFHDTGPQHPLRPDLNRLEQQGLLKLLYLPTPRGVGLAQVQ
jgi:predicted O-methyltransferase YrrM